MAAVCRKTVGSKMQPKGPQARALRTSCDNCHRAKLKCVSTPTACRRCLNLNLECVHSPPGRSGRVPASERKDQSHRSATETLTPPPSSSSRTPSEYDVGPTVAGWGPDEAIADAHNVDNTCTATLNAAIDSDSRQIEAMMGGLDSLPRPDPGTLYSNFDTVKGVPLTMPPLVSGLHSSPTAALAGFTMDDISVQTPHPGLNPLTNAGSHQIGRQMFAFDAMDLTCGCFRSIVRALDKIQDPAIGHLSLDIALSVNKSALVDICNSLKCTSAHDGTTRLLTLVLVQKALCLYRSLYHSRLRNRTETVQATISGPFSPSSTPTSTSPMAWPSMTGNISQPAQGDDHQSPDAHSHQNDGGLGNARLSLGSYQLDHDDESSLTRQILILDLNKIPRLLERLDRRACGLDGADGLDLYNLMRCSLISDFRSLVTEAAAQA